MQPIQVRSIDPLTFYRFVDITRILSISTQSLHNWRKSGRMIVCPHNPSLVRGDHLLDAIKDKRPKKARYANDAA